jgi:uncharacterized protein DUF4926
MKFKMLQVVVLKRDLRKHKLRKGDLGTVVERYEPDGLEVEFLRASGDTQAVVTLRERDVRPIDDRDVKAVRRLGRSA